MRRSVLFVLAVVLVVVPLAVQSHILKLKDGRILKGQFISGMTDVVRFHVEGDTIRDFSVDDIISIHFSSATIDAAPPPPAEPVKIFPGTAVRIKLTAELGTRKSSAGDRFFAEIAEDFVVDGITLCAKGKRVFGRVRKVVKPKRSGDRAVIEILLTDLTIAGKKQPVITDFFGVENDGEGIYQLLGTAKPVDAGVPQFMDDRHVQIPIGTVLEFRITQPVTVRNVTR
jgi:hypothetical protein